MSNDQTFDVSFVIPFMNEEATLESLCSQIQQQMKKLNQSHEILLIDDGSTDEGPAIAKGLADRHESVFFIQFRRNFGKAAALDAGFRRARGELVFTMDADLQDDPNEIPKMIEKLEEGYDLVSGWKQKRKDPLGKTLPSKLFNRVVGYSSGLKLHDFNCGFKVYRHEVVKSIRLYGELHRFVPVLAHFKGFRVTELPVVHHARQHGQSKYGVERLIKGFFDLMTVILTTRFASRPLHIFGATGLLFGLSGFGILGYLTTIWFMNLGGIGTRPLFFLGILLVITGVQLVSTGLIAELIQKQKFNERGGDYQIRSDSSPTSKAQSTEAEVRSAASGVHQTRIPSQKEERHISV